MNMHNSWLHEEKISPEQAKKMLPQLEASNKAADPSQQVISLLQQLILEQQKLTSVICGMKGVALLPSANGKDILVAPVAELTTEQLVQHIDPNFCLEKVGQEHHLYDKRYPKQNELLWCFWGIEMGWPKPTYGELANAIQQLKNLRSQQK